MRRFWALGALLVGVPGCTVSAIDAGDDPRPNNSCSAAGVCDSGICRAGVCQALNGDIETLLLEVTPPADSPLPHLSLVTHVTDVPTGGGDLTFTIPRPVRVTGSLKALDCYPVLPQDGVRQLPQASDNSLPLSITLSPRERLLGLPQQLYVATTTGSGVDFSYEFELQVPAGKYDVYLVPPQGQSGCVVPPQLYRDQNIPVDLDNPNDVALKPEVSNQVLLDDVCREGATFGNTMCLRIRWPKTSPSLDGWVADIIEPLSGRAISTERVLGGAVDQGPISATLEYQVPLVYSTVNEPPGTEINAAVDLVRLRPATDVIAPTILLDRSGLGLLSKTNSALLDNFTQLPAKVRVEGQVARQDDGTPVGGYVTLVSAQIFGVDAGIFASFQTTVQVREDGVFELEMPPGKYRVHAVPATAEGVGTDSAALAALLTEWDVPADIPFQAGKLLELPSITSIKGQSAFPGAQVQVQARPQSILPFDEAFGAAAFVPRANSGLVDVGGRFEVQVDPGSFDLSVRAPDDLGFAWFVRPGVQVVDASIDLGRVGLPQPAVLTGSAFVELTANTVDTIPSALVRAYAYLDEDLKYTRDLTRAVSVIQVAGTRTDDAGAFRLLLPSSIAAP
jgi:hypothetical protein